jgi:folate-dependent phosphoribosylglycinamide formyltransferase PurN
MKTILMCHENDFFDKEIVARWLSSFSDLAGVVLINEHTDFKKKRYKYEYKRSGFLGFIDIVLYKIYHRIFLRKSEARLNTQIINRCLERFPSLSEDIPVFTTTNPKNNETQSFISELAPDIMIVRAKMILTPNIFEIPKSGTFVLHPGICPQYRNAHGCYWAIANKDYNNVGVTLLKIDRGIDTGPIYGYFRYKYNSKTESHNIIQTKVVSENFEQIKDKLIEINNNEAQTIGTEGLPSNVYGQPKLSSYLFQYRSAEV